VFKRYLGFLAKLLQRFHGRRFDFVGRDRRAGAAGRLGVTVVLQRKKTFVFAFFY